MKAIKSRLSMLSLMVASALVLCVLALSACGGANVATNTEFTFNADDAGIHAIAKNGADATNSDDFTVKSGSELNIKAVVNSGAFEVKVTDSTGKAILDEEITQSTTKTVPAEGTVKVEVTARGADGTVDIS